jgi:hypothetical protein
MIKSRRDDAIALGTVSVVAAGYALGYRFYTFRLFFGWPNGGTWSNTIAAGEWVFLVAFFGWYMRDRLVPRLAVVVHRHWKPHADQSHDDTRRHVSNELISLESRIGDRLDGIEQLIRETAGGGPDPS